MRVFLGKSPGCPRSEKRGFYSVRALMTAATGITLALALFLVVYVLAKGLPNLSFELVDNGTELSVMGRVGILPVF